MMSAEKIQYCWDIMQCDEESPCPVKEQKIKRCWDWMREHDQFQCQYGLCYECIVYLCNNENTILSEREIEQVMIRRGLYDKGIHPSESATD